MLDLARGTSGGLVADIITRRTFLKGAAGLGVTGLGAGSILTTLASEPALAELLPIGMAMHVHSSFSEGTASMLAQLDQAVTNAVDVLWWSDHDWRMSGHGYRREVHFDGFTETEDGAPLSWKVSRSGTLRSSSVAFVPTPASPQDPHGPSALQLTATCDGASFATIRCTADASAARETLRGSLAGTTISIDVFPQAVGLKAYLEIRVRTSSHPATAGRAAGAYAIAYRIGGPDPPGTFRTQGLTGYVTLDAPVNAWSTLVLQPTADIARLWPDLQPTDGSLYEFSVAAGSKGGGPASACVDYLRFARDVPGDAPLDVQRQLMDAYATRFPGVTQYQALEVSLYQDHVNWFGGALTIPSYDGVPAVPAPNDPLSTAALVGQVHDGGGLASLNHVFGSTSPALGSASTQEKKRRTVTTKLVGNRAFGSDILEVGYQTRGGVNLARHLGVWDACSRNAIFLTGNGVNDNHGGPWTGQNDFLTWAWSGDRSQQQLGAALASGRCFFGDPAKFQGQLDLMLDGVCPMGSASVSDLPSRSLEIAALGLPDGGSVRLVQGPIDLAGPGVPEPGTVVTTIPANAFTSGTSTVSLDTSVATFARVEVADPTGLVIAGSNPVWMLRAEPPTGIPDARRA